MTWHRTHEYSNIITARGQIRQLISQASPSPVCSNSGTAVLTTGIYSEWICRDSKREIMWSGREAYVSSNKFTEKWILHTFLCALFPIMPSSAPNSRNYLNQQRGSAQTAISIIEISHQNAAPFAVLKELLTNNVRQRRRVEG